MKIRKLRKDMTGQKFYRLTFVKPCRRNGRFMWKTKCDCGTISYNTPHTVISGKVKSCGCYNREVVAPKNGRDSSTKDWTGKKYGRLTFIRPTKKRHVGKVVWKLRCDCGKNTYKWAREVVAGNNVSCGCRRKEVLATFGERGIRKHDPIVASARSKWGQLYRDCNFDVYFMLAQMPCFYCGRDPHRTYNIRSSPSHPVSKRQLQEGNFVHNGLDRVDNTKGHTSDNVVPCCSDCNYMKGTRTVEEFLAHIERIHGNTSNIRSKLIRFYKEGISYFDSFLAPSKGVEPSFSRQELQVV